MKTMTNPKEFFEIHKDSKEFRDKVLEGNFAIRRFISSYGFKSPKELANELIEMASRIN